MKRFGKRRPVQPIVPEVVITHSLIVTLQGESNPQLGSPIFSTIPPELRNKIFLFALTSYDDESEPYPENSYYSRPGYRFRQYVHTALLATCRRIYTETHDLPLSLNEHVFWGSVQRGPPIRDCDNPKAYFGRMTAEQRNAVVNVHFFTQLFWLEGTFPKVCGFPEFRAKHIKITVRHADWWFWESNSPLRMEENWCKNLKSVVGLEGLEVELETIERDKAQLESIVKVMSKWRVELGNGQILTTEGTQVMRNRYAVASRASSRQENRGSPFIITPRITHGRMIKMWILLSPYITRSVLCNGWLEQSEV